MYDYVIIGGGPGGINTALHLSNKYKVCLIESLESLGGCHRVRYAPNKVNNDIEEVHTEHGPRVYIGSYLNFWSWIKQFDTSKDDFIEYYSMFSYEVLSFMKFTPIEFLSLTWAFIRHNILHISYSDNYTVDDFMNHIGFTDESRLKLDKLCRTLDGGDTHKTLLGVFLEICDTGPYKIYEPTKPLNHLIWNKAHDLLVDRNVNILFDSNVSKIDKNVVYLQNGTLLKTNKIIVTVPPVACANIEGLDKYFANLEKRAYEQEYDSYLCATVGFDKFVQKHKWGIPGEHPWQLITMDMGRYFNKNTYPGVKSMFVISVTYPENVDPKLGMTANDMNSSIFLHRIVEIIREEYDISIDNKCVIKSLNPSLSKKNKEWVEHDRAFVLSPPGFLKPNSELEDKDQVWFTGHHIGNSFHRYNSIESAIQNSNALLSRIEPDITIPNYKPLMMSSIITMFILIILIIYLIFKINSY
uniref:Amine oxidase domain-containing protein n=1 Tax=viral metagenome TaxID=1070528 RepID=A0A6C0F6D3_9ZZZZ|tara:strand:+ start:4461 stop:5870 length:1410 start_codon:yes stop_codon:yes gene_type:complete